MNLSLRIGKKIRDFVGAELRDRDDCVRPSDRPTDSGPQVMQVRLLGKLRIALETHVENRHNAFATPQRRSNEVREMEHVRRTGQGIEPRPSNMAPTALKYTTWKKPMHLDRCSRNFCISGFPTEVQPKKTQPIAGHGRFHELFGQHSCIPPNAGSLGNRRLIIHTDLHARQCTLTNGSAQGTMFTACLKGFFAGRVDNL